MKRICLFIILMLTIPLPTSAQSPHQSKRLLLELHTTATEFETELEKLNKEVERVQKKLGNESFVAKAPEKIVAVEKDKEQEYLEQRDKVLSRINELKA